MNLTRSTPKEEDDEWSGFLYYFFRIISCVLFEVFFYSISFALYPFPVSSLQSDLYYLKKVTDIINPNDQREIYKWVPVTKSTLKLAATIEPYYDPVENLRLGLFLACFILAIFVFLFFKWVCVFSLLNKFSFLTLHKWMVILLITSLSDLIEKSSSTNLTFIICSLIAFLIIFITTTFKSDSTGFTDGALMGFTKLCIVFAFGQNREGVFYSMGVVICVVFAKLREIKSTAAEKATAQGTAASGTQSPVDLERKSI